MLVRGMEQTDTHPVHPLIGLSVDTRVNARVFFPAEVVYSADLLSVRFSTFMDLR